MSLMTFSNTIQIKAIKKIMQTKQTVTLFLHFRTVIFLLHFGIFFFK